MIKSLILAAIVAIVALIKKPWKEDSKTHKRSPREGDDVSNEKVPDWFVVECLKEHLPSYYPRDVVNVVWRDLKILISRSHPYKDKPVIFEVPVSAIEGALRYNYAEFDRALSPGDEVGPADRLYEFPDKERFIKRLKDRVRSRHHLTDEQ